MLLYFSVALIPALIAMFASSYWFADGITGVNLVTNHSDKIELSWLLSIRLYLLAMISFGFMLHAPQEKIILNLLQQKLLPVNLGFALLAVNNAVNYLTEEFKRIQIAYQMRYQRRSFSPKIILPLLVAASRYAHHLSISMHSRGLNNVRSYHQPAAKFSQIDIFVVALNIVILSVLIYIN
jgi:energy-coupling factor transporter transmembrane protein EcfT